MGVWAHNEDLMVFFKENWQISYHSLLIFTYRIFGDANFMRLMVTFMLEKRFMIVLSFIMSSCHFFSCNANGMFLKKEYHRYAKRFLKEITTNITLKRNIKGYVKKRLASAEQLLKCDVKEYKQHYDEWCDEFLIYLNPEDNRHRFFPDKFIAKVSLLYALEVAQLLRHGLKNDFVANECACTRSGDKFNKALIVWATKTYGESKLKQMMLTESTCLAKAILKLI